MKQYLLVITSIVFLGLAGCSSPDSGGSSDGSSGGSATPPPGSPPPSGGNQAPTAVIGTPSVSALTVSLSGTGSSDPEGGTLIYSWNFGDGATASGATTSHTYASAGSYQVRLTVTDPQSASGQSTRTVTVSSGGSSPGATGLPFLENFEDQTWSKWAYSPAGNIQILGDPGCAEGSYCVRGVLTSGTHSDNYADFLFGDHVSVGRPDKVKVEDVWVKLRVKFSSGYVWPGSSQKIAIFNLTDGVSLGRRYQVYIYVNALGRYVVDHSYIDTWQFFGLPQNIPAGSAPVTARFDTWDELKLHARLNTPGQSNGVVELWINGVKKIEYTNVNIRQGTAYGINKFILSTYATPSSGSNGQQWFDDIQVTTTDPG